MNQPANVVLTIKLQSSLPKFAKQGATESLEEHTPGCFSAAFPCAPFQRWRRASCRTWASSFCAAVASSNLPRSTSYIKNKQLQLIVSFYKYFGHNNSFMKAKQQKTNNNDKTMRKIDIFCQRTFTHDKPSTKS